MSDSTNDPLKGFQLTAQNATGLNDETAAKLTVDWPVDMPAVLNALVAAGVAAGPSAVQMAKDIWSFAPQSATAPAAATTPIQVTLTQPVDVVKMKLFDLLQALTDEPNNDELLVVLKGRKQVTDVQHKSDSLAAVDEHGKLEPRITLDYLAFLVHGKPQRVFKKHRIVSFEKALGRKETRLHHPLYANQYINMGLDENGYDWSNVDAERMKAAKWARETRHEKFPRPCEAYDEYTALSAEKLNARWAAIVADYEAAVANDDLVVSLVVKEGESVSDNSFRRVSN
jgi:hypothetical protein